MSEKEKDSNKENNINWLAAILSGQFLVREIIGKNIWFIIYIFLLIIGYITINLGVEQTQLTLRRNQRELKNLKADYTSKSAKLQFLSKRGEVEARLINQESDLINPVSPPKVIKKR